MAVPSRPKSFNHCNSSGCSNDSLSSLASDVLGLGTAAVATGDKLKADGEELSVGVEDLELPRPGPSLNLLLFLDMVPSLR